MIFSHLSAFQISPVLIVIDLETKSTLVTAQISTVGAVAINIITGEIIESFYKRCLINGQEDRSVDADTLQFWEAQRLENPNAYNEAFSDKLERFPLPYVLLELNEFIKNYAGERPSVVGNGSEFDNAIVLNSLNQYQMKPSWDYGRNQSLRTVFLLSRMLLNYDPLKHLTQEGDKHHALDDAIFEAQCLHAIFNKFMKKIDSVDVAIEALLAIRMASTDKRVNSIVTNALENIY